MSALWHVGYALDELICVRADDVEAAAVAFVMTHDAASDFNVANGAPISVYVRADGVDECLLVEVFGSWSPTYVGYARMHDEGGAQ